MFKTFILFLLLTVSIYAHDTNTTHVYFTPEEENFIKNNPIIYVGAESDWPPFDFVENGSYTGYSKDTLDLIEKHSGLKFKYVTDTWANLVSKARNKEIDMLPCLSKTAKREEFLLFTEAYITTRDYLFTKENNNTIKKIEDIKGKRAAVIKGYVQEETFKKDYPDVKLYYANNLLDAMDSVITNKADFIVANIALMNYHTKKYSISGLEAKFHFGFNWNRLHMATNQDNAVLRNILQKSLDVITTDEENKIISKWIDNKEFKDKKSNNLDLSNEELAYIKNNKTVIIANEYDWIPYDYNEKGVPKGYSIDYIKLILQKLDIKPIFITDKWSIMYNDFKAGKIDIMPVVGHNKKREEYMSFTQSYLSQTLSIVTKKSRTDIVNSDDLSNKKIAMIKDWNLTKKFRNEFPNANIIEFENIEDVFDAIRDNFVDATVQNRFLSLYLINKNYYGDLKIASSISLKTFDGKLYIGVKKDLKILHKLLDKAIAEVSEKEIKALEDKWVNISKDTNFTKEELKFIENNVIKITTTDNWAPFLYKDDDSNLKGIGYDLWTKIANDSNLKFKINIEKTFNNSVTQIKEKKQDLILVSSKVKESEQFAIFSDPYLSSILGIATLQDKGFIADTKELLGKRIAVGKKFTAHKLLEENYPSMDFVFVNSVKEGLEILSQNKAYAYIDLMPILSYNIKSYGYTNIKISGQTGINFKLNMMIRDDLPILQSIINKVLNKMTIAEKDAIYDKWLSVKYQEKSDYSLLWKIVLVFILILFFVVYKNRQLVQYQKKLEFAKEDTEKSLSNFKTLIELNVAGILIIRDKQIKYLNDESLTILGYSSKSELINKNVSMIFNTENLTNLCDVLASSDSYEMTAISKTKRIIPVLLKGQAIEFDNLPSHIISLIDLTEIKDKEELMIQQSKMASLGEMIGNIAHQWRQPLSSISTTSSGLKLQKEFNQLDDKIFNESLDNITETTKFLSETIDDFQNYIKEDKLQKEFNILNSIEKVLTLMKGSFVSSFIIVESKLEEIVVNSYENELNQVLLNILSNAKDALKNINEKHRHIYISTYKTKKYAVIEIIDNGGGIDKKIIKKVFEPYFTTKHKSQGTGLGLYMTHKILTDSMKGLINIENCSFHEYDKCTKVTLKIPF